MGLADLRQLAVIEDVAFADLAGSSVAVDFHNWLYRYLTIVAKFTDESAYTTADGTEVANLLGIAKGLPKFYANDISPVFVFDGPALDLKADELQRRRDRREAAEDRLAEAEEAGDDAAVRRLRARTQRLTPTVLETSRELLATLDVPVVDAPAEAEAQAAHMAREGAVDYVSTEDYDALLFGAPLTLRQLTSGGDPELMDLAATLSSLDITREQLVDLAILCGTDYNDGVHGVGPKTALKRLSAGESLEEVVASRDASIPDLAAVRRIYLEPAVTDDYSVDLDWSPAFDEARSYLAEWEIPPDRLDRAFERLTDAAR